MQIILENDMDYKDMCALYGMFMALTVTNSLIESSVMMDRLKAYLKTVLMAYRGAIIEKE